MHSLAAGDRTGNGHGPLTSCLAKIDDEEHSLVEIPPETTHISKSNRRDVSIANGFAERLVLGALIDEVAAGAATVVVDRGQVEIVIAAVVSD